MYVDIDLLKALESAWDNTASAVRALDVESIRNVAGAGLPGSLTEQSLRTDVIGDAFGVAAIHFEALATLARGTNNDYVVTEAQFVFLVNGAGRR